MILRRLFTLAAGLIFGLGLTISQMVNPAKVIAFFDVAGAWDPSLALVMAGALAVTFVGYRIAWRWKAPLFDASFHLPTTTAIDARLISGAALFGVGWGLAGYCPAPAVAAIGLGQTHTFLFIVAMVAGMALYRWGEARSERAAARAS